jgi:uncharacterized protein YndB with AHSA1/START domain
MTKLNLFAETGKHEIRMTREFNAPRELVFKAFTDPALIPRWWGPAEYTTLVDKMEVKAGGLWRYIQRSATGEEFSFYGVYHSVLASERIIFTFEWEGMPGHVLLETVTFEERDGKTTITDALVFQTVADRDGMIQSGMERGAVDSWNRLEALLPQLQP